MRGKNKQSISSGDNSFNLQASRDINIISVAYPTSLIDKNIKEETEILRRSRFYVEFDRENRAVIFGQKLFEGELSQGTDTLKGIALAWCARLLSRTDLMLNEAEKYLDIAQTLTIAPEIQIADAFLKAQKGNMSAALRMLASIDSSAARSASFMIVTHHEGREKAFDWLLRTKIEVSDLDSDGKYFFLANLLALGHWDEAKKNINELSPQDFSNTPALHHILGIITLLSAVPLELRSNILSQIPFHSAHFRLADDVDSINARRSAQRHFAKASEAALGVNCPSAAALADEYALWLELRDPEYSNQGKQKLEEKLHNAESTLRLVPLCIQFEIKLGLEKVRQEIEQRIALHGGTTYDTAIARFALAFTEQTPEGFANYITRHYEELSTYLDSKSLRFIQIEMFSRAGLIEKANSCFDLILEEGVSEADVVRITSIISEAEGNDPVAIRKAQFEQSDAINDLEALVVALEHQREWNDLSEYGMILYQRTRSVGDAERLINALSRSYKTDEVIQFSSEHSDLLSQSQNLQMSYCWALYREGLFVKAQTELEKLNNLQDNPNYRGLKKNLAIALGDWNSLVEFVANEFMHREKRSARDLIGTAQLALKLNSLHAKELLFEAVSKADADADVFALAYFLASSAGWEEDSEVFAWLQKAVELSGDDGPIKTVTIEKLFDWKPDWERQELETWQSLNRGKLPIFLAAHFLNKSLIDLILLPAFANSLERDPRNRNIIPAYSGNRLPISLQDIPKTVGIDATALLTLGFIDAINQVLDAFDVVYLPHSTFAWLFTEKQKIGFHQPSRVRDARYISNLLARDTLKKFILTTTVNSDLSLQVGDELAKLIAEAEKNREGEEAQHIVVRSSPVYRVSTLMDEEADLSQHSTILSSCLAVVEKLRAKGQITASEEQHALNYLRLREKPWPNQPEIHDGAVLYLDDLTINYFIDMKLLDRLQAAGLKPIVSQRAISVANALMLYESVAEKIDAVIELVRSSIRARISSGKVRFGRQPNFDELSERSILQHPTAEILFLAQNCDAVILDDRFVNQRPHVDDGGARSLVLTTIDILNVLVATDILSEDDLFEYRTLLRRAGFALVPISADELKKHITACEVKSNRIVETAELKAIRENILKIRMSDWLQLPEEAQWLNSTLGAFIMALKGIWENDASLSDVIARSNWIVDQVDIRGWVHCFEPKIADNLIGIGQGSYILPLLTPPPNASQEIAESYHSWIENSVLSSVKQESPELYEWIVNWYDESIFGLTERDWPEEKLNEQRS